MCKRAVWILLILVGLPLSSPAQSPPSQSDLLAKRVELLAHDPVRMTEVGEGLWSNGASLGDCDSLQLALHLLLAARNQLGNPEPLEEVNAFTARYACSVDASVLAYGLGYHAVLRMEWGEADAWFGRAADLAQTEQVAYRIAALQAQAVVKLKLHEHRAAYRLMKRAVDLDPEVANPEALNTMAYLCLLLGDVASSRMWCEVGRERIVALKAQPEVDAVWYEAGETAINLTELLSALMTDDVALGNDLLKSLTPASSFDQRELSAVSTITAFLQESEQWKLAENFRQMLVDLAQKDTSIQRHDILGMNARLYPIDEPLQEQEWIRQMQALARAPLTLRGLPFARVTPAKPVLRRPLALEVHQARNWTSLFGFAFIVAAGAAAGTHWTRRRTRKWQGLPTEEIRAFLEANMAPSFFRTPHIQVAAALNEFERRAYPNNRELTWEELADWPALERKVAEGLMRGQNSKELAMQLGLSMNQMYKLRAAIRTRLNLPAHVVLDDWLKTTNHSE